MTESSQKSQTFVVEESDLQVTKLTNGLVRVPIAQIGEWKHPQYGEVKFSLQDFEQTKTNFENGVLGFESYLTFGHPKSDDSGEAIKDYLEEAQAFDAERKRGDCREIFIEGNTLYGDYAASQKTLDAVDAGEFEYCSGEFINNFIDKDSGKNIGTVLVRSALTNAPFIPLTEKVRVISVNEELDTKKLSQSPHSTFHFGIKLSQGQINTGTENLGVEPSKENTTNIINSEKLATNNTNPNAEATAAVTAPADISAEVKPAEVASVSPVEVTSSAQEAAPAVTTTTDNELVAANVLAATEKEVQAAPDIEAIIKEVTAAFTSKFEQAKEGYEKTIAALQTNVEASAKQIAELTDKVVKQQEVSLKFSQNLSQQAKQAKAEELATKGVPPALIKRYSLLTDQISQANSNIAIKLSTQVEGKAVEVNSSLAEQIESLLVDSLNANPVDLTKLGQTTPAESGLEANFRKMAEANREKAKKLQAK